MTTNEAERLLLVELFGFLEGLSLAFVLTKQPGINRASVLAERLIQVIG